MKFDDLITEQMSKLDEAPASALPTAPEAAPQPNDPDAGSKLPPTPTAGAEPAAPMTPEGKVFLIDLARKALAFNPNQLPEFDKEVLGTQVNADNAEQVLKDIQRIVGTN